MLPRTTFVFLVCFAFYALFRPEPWAMPEHLPDFDKFAHFLLFLAISCSSYFVFVSGNPVFYQLIPLLFLAVFSEWYQGVSLTARHFSMGDMAADLLGILGGFLFCLGNRRKNWFFKNP